MEPDLKAQTPLCKQSNFIFLPIITQFLFQDSILLSNRNLHPIISKGFSPSEVVLTPFIPFPTPLSSPFLPGIDLFYKARLVSWHGVR